MIGQFQAEIFQNEYLPAGAREVHAILSVTATAGTAGLPMGEKTFGIVCDVSGSMEGSKLDAAKAAMSRMVDMLPPDCSFFIIAGADGVQLVSPLQRAEPFARQQAKQAIAGMRAFGGTRISNWLQAVLDQLRGRPAGGVRQVLLLTDGQNDAGDAAPLESVLRACEGIFQCDCRGVGTDWQVAQLRPIATRLLGTVDIVPSVWEMDADFRTLLERALARTVSDVVLRLWTPAGAVVRYCKQVSPQLLDLTARARILKPQLRDFPTGAWTAGESRDFHFCVEVNPGITGDEVLAGRVSLLVSTEGVETKASEGRMLAVWTDDEAKSTRIDRVVAHYTGQAELADSIQRGLEARSQGDTAQATVLLGRAVKLAHDSGNEATAKLLRRVVDVDDASRGTVRLRTDASKADAMALDTRSTKTTRLARGN